MGHTGVGSLVRVRQHLRFSLVVNTIERRTGHVVRRDFDRQDIKIRRYRDTLLQKTSVPIAHEKRRHGYALVRMSAAVE